MKKLIALSVAFFSLLSCSKHTQPEPINQKIFKVKIEWIDFDINDNPLNNSFFSIYVNKNNQKTNFSSKHLQEQVISEFDSKYNDTIKFNINSEKSNQLGYVPIFRITYNLDTFIINVSDTTNFIIKVD